MAPRTMKYNPAFLTEQELVESFVVRQADLHLVLQTVRENSGPSNQHVLLVGPRGIGKTTLALRLVAEVHRTPELAARWYPIVFAEESYQVASPGEFWLETLFHLARQTGDPKWHGIHEELKRDPDEERLRERALAHLMDFADAEGKRLLLVVENLDALLGAQLSDTDAWVVRHTLMNEPRLMLFASATSHFQEVRNASKALFEQFKTHELRPLDTSECAAVWTSLTGQEVTLNRIRPIEILTGGNPRLLTIIARFGARMSLQELLTDLTRLVDEHTEYFKSHLDGLAPTERKVYLALAESWEPATARTIAAGARLDVSKTSALLNRLVDRGAVSVVHQRGRKKSYQVAERMYNIYYLMRRRGGPSGRIKAAIRFMVGMYRPEESVPLAYQTAQDALSANTTNRTDHHAAYNALLRRLRGPNEREQVPRATPEGYLADRDTPQSVEDWLAREEPCPPKREENNDTVLPGHVEQLLSRDSDPIVLNRIAWTLCERGADLELAEKASRDALAKDAESVPFHLTLAYVLCRTGRIEEALARLREYVGPREVRPDDIERLIEVMASLALQGMARPGVDILLKSPNAPLLEPLIGALRLHVGEEMIAPTEIVEVAKDIVRRIESRRDSLGRNSEVLGNAEIDKGM